MIGIEDIVRFAELPVRCAAVLDRHAWALLRRLTRWLDQFKDCFGHRAQHVSLRQYVDGLLGDSARKSMSAMLARVSEPDVVPSLPALHHACPVGCRGRCGAGCGRVLPERTGILILDETSFPKVGPAFGRRGAPVLRRAGQGGELPSRGDRGAVDRPARMADGRLAVSARGVDAAIRRGARRRGFLRRSSFRRSGGSP